MSLQLNLSSPDIANAYQEILNARGIDWVVLTYEKASNDLRVQSTGNGLEDLEEEFSDGRQVKGFYFSQSLSQSRARIQYVFCRVKDPNVGPSEYLISLTAHYLPANRPSYISSCRSTGVAMGFRRRKRDYFILIRPPLPASSAELTS